MKRHIIILIHFVIGTKAVLTTQIAKVLTAVSNTLKLINRTFQHVVILQILRIIQPLMLFRNLFFNIENTTVRSNKVHICMDIVV